MRYRVEPGLYALGSPDADSEVLVTANYKLSFDTLRSALNGGDYWILVLDTNAVNVWCAAGKGTFGTAELVRRIETVGLTGFVNHRRVIVPQLGAPGVAAHLVREQCGFKVVYGPVKASDIPPFLKAGRRADPSMRKKTFTLGERLAVVPIELVAAPKFLAPVVLLIGAIGGLTGSGDFLENAVKSGLTALFAVLAALLAGAVLTPALLPILPGRSFSAKSLLPGIALGVAVVILRAGARDGWRFLAESAGLMMIVASLGAFLAMNFTGASTYTSPSGVKKEMKLGLPLQAGAAVVGLALWIASQSTG
jgi:acetyl-CoA decarbonylase/synthase complex subunit gamma